ncbi:beta-galactosidase [Saccharicrinis fermentans]|nr:beta-galactosidase [Saccharicrinis fermentans]
MIKKRLIVAMFLVGVCSSILAQNFFPKKDLMSVGVYYYPEHWSPDQWERDVKNIAKHGFEFIHMAEFAWAQMEPTERQFDFSWLDRMVELAEANGLKIILGTPTACPPVWLGEKYPDIYMMDANYQRKEHGTRANLSLSNPWVKEYTKRIVTAMARRYGNCKTVMGWQIDNEPEAKEDYSEAAQQAFRLWLKDKYGSVEILNEAWGTAFWSQRYASIDEVRIHNASNVGWWGVNPIALLDYKRFTADTQAAYLDLQAHELRKHIAKYQFVTTNYVAKGSQSDPGRSQQMDFASFTAYPNYGSANLGELGFRLGDYSVLMFANDYYPSLNGTSGVMELQPGQVNWAQYNALLQPGTVRMWLWHCFAASNSFACTYRYRQVLYGAEQYHHGITSTDGLSLSQGGKEYVQVIQEIKRLRELYQPHLTMPKKLQQRKAAILWSFDNLWSLERQKQTNQWNTWKHMQRYQQVLHSLGAPVSFISEQDDFNEYPFLIVPAYEMVDEALVEKWKAYVRQGGKLIISARTGAKNKNAHLWEDNLSGIMNSLIGGELTSFDMLPKGKTGSIMMNGKAYSWSAWGEHMRPYEHAGVLASYDDQFFQGTACVISNEIGRGKVWYLGVVSCDGLLERDVIRNAYEQSKVGVESYPEGVLVGYRDGFMVAVNYSSEDYILQYAGHYLVGDRILKPADVAVWMVDEGI